MSKVALFFLGLPGVSFLFLAAAAAAEDGALPSPTTIIAPIVVILILVLINGFFVAAEIAIVGVRPSRMEQMAEAGNAGAQKVLTIVNSRDKQDQYIATAQLGITIASLGLAMYGEPQIAHFIEPYLFAWLPSQPTEAFVSGTGYIIALSLLTYLHIVLGEMVPKSLALTDAGQVSMWLSRPMRGFEWVMAYPVRILNGIGRFLLRVFRVPPVEGHARVLSPEELELLVTESAEEGLLHVEEQEMIRNIFDFGDRTVGQVLTPRRTVQGIPVATPYDELVNIVISSRHSRFPVYVDDLDHVIGMLHIKDLVKHSLKKHGGFDIRLLMRALPTIPEDQPVETLLARFKRQKLHMGIVLDEFGGMAGIVTLEDLVEEIVGEVRDEFDLEKEPFVEISPGIVEVDGEYLVDDLLEDVVFLEDEEKLPDVETVGGLIIAKLGAPPVVGDEVTYNDGRVRMKVLIVDRRAVTRARIEFPASEKGEGGETAVPKATTQTDSTPRTLSNLIDDIRDRRKKWIIF